MDYHEVAAIFPLMEGQDFADLKDDIQKHGLLEPVWIFEGKILDGRNRYRACKELGIEVATREWFGSDPVSFVVSLNLKRRHLKESQRGMVAARIATLSAHRPSGTASIEAVKQPEAAKMMNVSRSTVQRARTVLAAGSKELVAAVDRGETSVNAAVGKLIETGAVHPKTPTTSGKRRQWVENAQKERMVRALSTINGLCTGLGDMNIADALMACTPEEQRQWGEKALDLSAQLRAFGKNLLNERMMKKVG